MKLKTENQLIQAIPIEVAEYHQFLPPIHQPNPTPHNSQPINDAMQIKAAEYWLKLGEADQALRELEPLPENTWNCLGVVRLRVTAMGMLRERREMMGVL